MNILNLKQEYAGKKEIHVEIPNNDAHMILFRVTDYANYIAQYGNPEVVQDNQRSNLFRVPAFTVGREAYTEAKRQDCAEWGCE